MQTFDDYALDRACAKRVGSLIHVRGRVAVVQTTIPVNPDALHVSAADLALVSRGSLANLDPFVVTDISVREAIVGGHCGCWLSLALAGDRVREWADAD